jgi:CheY-like chemotaxis protein
MIKGHPELSHVRLVAHTGYGSPEDRKKAREAGFDAHLVKPAELDDLAKALRGD